MRVKYINLYMCNLAYGGPEEGGWWYMYGEPLRSIPVRPRTAQRHLKRVRRWTSAQNEGRRPMESVLSEGEYDAFLEDHPAQGWPATKPHYE